ncbi:MAG: SDR family oxidoreductase [Saprospiraceae bacterium]|nr:SDR family oxidoreductase [Saprospiraceae bacterium]
MFQPDLFQNQIVLVTGGGSGIGYAVAEQFLLLGAKVYIASRKEERVQKAAEQLRAIGPCEYAACDIRRTEDIQHLADDIREKEGRLDILINNAGGQFPSTAEDINEKGWNAVINNNLNGTWNMTQSMAKNFFIPQNSGVIINIIVNIYRGVPGMAHTGAARAGVDSLTKSLAVEWSRYGIRVNAVAPGIIQSSGLDNYPPQLLQGLSDKIPMKRLGSVAEAAWPILFLAGPAASYITGETLYVDGGSRLWGDFFEL